MNLYFVLSCQADEKIIEELKKYGNVILVYPHPNLHEAVSCHADMQLAKIDNKVLVYAKGINQRTLDALYDTGIELIEGGTQLLPKYPGNIAYNVLKVGRNIYHNTKYTDCIVRKVFTDKGYDFVNVRQGYAGCSSIYVKNFILTTDKGIEKKAKEMGDRCFWFNGDDIILKGYDHGFIGGCSGFIEDLGLLLTGSLEYHKEGRLVKEFLLEQGVNILELKNDLLEDIGGIQIYKL
ncbi:MAG TPA: hypothetical protein PLI11_04450 [Clostridia bacterium]|nr:hypothetical protein [Clostridiaceae bacterium]HPZ52147.1 hypothetical protein [Clostridia bacterium]